MTLGSKLIVSLGAHLVVGRLFQGQVCFKVATRSTVTLGQPVMAFGAASTLGFGNDTPFGSTSSPFG